MNSAGVWDVVVIGAGVAGLVAARDLIEAGRDVVVDSQPRSFRLATDARFSRCD